ATGRVAEQRLITATCIVVAGHVVRERSETSSGVEDTGCVARECCSADRRVFLARCVPVKRSESDRRVVGSDCQAEERIITLSRVLAGIASVRWWINGPDGGRERKAAERERCERGIGHIHYCFHVFFLSSLFSEIY